MVPVVEEKRPAKDTSMDKGKIIGYRSQIAAGWQERMLTQLWHLPPDITFGSRKDHSWGNASAFIICGLLSFVP